MRVENEIKASGTEALIYGAAAHMNMHLHLEVEFSYKIDKHLLTQALDYLFDSDPIIGAKFVWKNNYAFWKISEGPEWEINEYFTDHIDRGIELMRLDKLKKPQKISNALPICISIIHANDIDRVFFHVDHLLCDGGGIKNLIYKLSSVYKKLHLNIELEPVIATGSPRHTGRILRATSSLFFFKDVFNGILALRRLKTKESYAIPMEHNPCSDGKYYNVIIENGWLERLMSCWKHSHITINDVLLTAIISAIAETINDPIWVNRIRILFMNDLRKFLPNEQYINNFTITNVLEIKGFVNYDQIELLERIHHKMLRWKMNKMALGQALVYFLAYGLLTHKQISKIVAKKRDDKNFSTIGFTNFGVVNENKVDFGKGPCTYLNINPPIPYANGFLVSATYCSQKLTICFGHWLSCLNEQVANKLINSIERQLHTLISRSEKKEN